MNKKLLIIPGTDFLRAYAGTRYLIESLQSAGVPVYVWIRCSKDSYQEYLKLPFPCRLFTINLSSDSLLSKLSRRLSGYAYRVIIFLKMLFSSQVLITESTYLWEAALVKRIKSEKFLLIHFCQELHLPEEFPALKIAKTYEKYAQVPDIVIDVEPNRARVRKERFKLEEFPVVLPNTIPFNALPHKAPLGTLATLAGLTSFNKLPILLHMGGLGLEKPLERVIDAISFVHIPVFFLAFCNGPNEQIKALQVYAAAKLLPNSFRILHGMPRDTLLASAWEADIGVIDYTYSVQPSINQRYCAPTKLYEFMALGLAILGSNNDSLKEILVKENIGICAVADHVEDLGAALHQILNDRDELHNMKDRARKAFAERYLYEQLCTPNISENIIKTLK